MNAGRFRWGIILTIMGLMIGVLALPAQATWDPPACPFTAGAGSHIVDFGQNGYKFIRSDRSEADAQTDHLVTNIPAGTYDITVYSYDDHDPDKVDQTDQTHEQWYLVASDGVGPNYHSGVTGDLADAANVRQDTVATGAVFANTITSVWAFHAFYPNSKTGVVSPNSITPICALFASVQQPGSITVVKEAGETSQTFTFSLDPDPGKEGSKTIPSGGQGTWADLEAGTYDLSETVPSGWKLTGISCGEAEVETSATGAQVYLAAGENVTCTFTNEKLPPPPTTTLPPPTTTTSPLLGSIGDFVWNDANDNGIQDTGEAGIAGVTVNLYDGGGNLLATTLTDGTGHYRFGGLVPGDYVVEFVLPTTAWEFSPADQGSDDAVDSDAGSNGRTGSITLAEGAGELTIDAGMYYPSKVEPTTVTRPPETLPFTGSSSSGAGGVGIGLVLLGGLILLALRRESVDG